jgi:hypothetical protein
MLIDELLYHLHHPESLDQFDEETLRNLIHQYPYLESLKSVYFKKSGNSSSSHRDLHEKLMDLTQVQFENHPDEMMSVTVFDLQNNQTGASDHSAMDSVKSALKPSAELEATSDLYVQHAPGLAGPSLSPYHLYHYDESEFIRYLKTLSPCKVPPVHSAEETPHVKDLIVHRGDPNRDIHLEKTEQLIASSIDLKGEIVSESLANLWAEQGKPELAIQIFEKLIVTNPEKSSIFAAKIAKLKADFSL